VTQTGNASIEASRRKKKSTSWRHDYILTLVLKESSGRPDGAEQRRLVEIKAFVLFRLHKWRSLLSELLFIPNQDRYVIFFGDFVTAKVWFILLLCLSEPVGSFETTLTV
jgi:hypothetical protein